MYNNKLYIYLITFCKAKKVVIKVLKASSASRSGRKSIDFDSEPSV